MVTLLLAAYTEVTGMAESNVTAANAPETARFQNAFIFPFILLFPFT
jgi:hypothetical protein